MFNNFNLSNNEILDIINQYMNLINKYSVVDGKIDEDLKQEILIGTLKDLRKNKKIKIFLKKGYLLQFNFAFIYRMVWKYTFKYIEKWIRRNKKYWG